VREVFDRLEAADLAYYMTGSEALARYGQPRQSMDVDIVVELDVDEFRLIEDLFEGDFLINPPIDFDGHLMASVMPLSALGKADLILAPGDPWSASAMHRRGRWDHPAYGSIWVISLEDLILAKLAWSAGTSELQLRDCRSLIELNRATIDWPYCEAWADRVGVATLLKEASDAS
jgi:hypothetical protein